jgi:hypothetical protein
MTRLFVLLILCTLALSSCRYWVLYEFSEQFCEFEEYVTTSWHDVTTNLATNRQVKINFIEPVLDRKILLRYLNSEPFESLNEQHSRTQKTTLSEDKFAIRQTHTIPRIAPEIAPENMSEPFQFKLTYHLLDEHLLLETSFLDSKLSQLFSPPLIAPILRSLCSDDYDLSLKQLDMRFTLSTLSKPSLPSLHQLTGVFGQAEEIIIDTSGEQILRYKFDFLTQDKQHRWQSQQKPITMNFGFDSRNQLKNLYLHYYKYSYWLDIENLSGRLLVIRGE